MQKNNIIIAVDGHSSCGKSTLSKQLAKELKYNYIDSGAMYRAVTLFAMQNKLINDHKVMEEELIGLLPKIKIEFRFNQIEQKSDTFLNGENVEERIRSMEVAGNVSPVATIKEVRQAMVRLQQEMGKNKGIVMDGRDIGTVVFPEAELKIFMTASDTIRAQRRFDELRDHRNRLSFEEVLQNVRERDHIDSTRKESPLKKAENAIVLDNSNMTRKEQLKWVLEKARTLIYEN